MNRRLKMMLGTIGASVFSLSALFAQTIQDGLSNLDADRTKQAKEIFTKLAEGTPSPENLYYLGYFYVRTNQLDEAQKAFEKGAALNEKDFLNQVGLGTVALGKGDKTKAQELFQLAEKKTKGKHAEVLFRAGEAYTLFEEKNNDPAEAIRLLDAAIKRNKDLADAYIAKGDALKQKLEGGPSVTAYEYALTARPNYALAYNRIGEMFLASKNYNLARENFNKAIEADPEFAPAYRDLAELFFMARQYKNAAENFDKYVQKTGTDEPEIILRAAQFAFTNDDFAKSLSLLDAIKGRINNPIMLRMYGWSYFKTNDLEKAISNIQEFIKVAPEKIIADDYRYLGRAINKMSDSGSYDSVGVSYIAKAAEIDTSKADAANDYKEIAALYYNDKKYEEASTYYSKGITMDTTAKGLTTDMYNLGISYFQTASGIVIQPGQLESADSTALAEKKKTVYLQADSVFAALSTKIPDWPFSYYWRASSLYNAYSREESMDFGAASFPHFEKFVELGEKSSDTPKGYLRTAYNNLAFYYQTKGADPEKAKMYWNKLLSVDPDNKSAKEALGLNAAATGDTSANNSTNKK